MSLAPAVQSRSLGELTVHALQAGGQRLDGGAMFGVVPKPLWERRLAADERNRIQLGMRCLLIEHPDALVLLDSGAGNKESAKFYDIYGIDRPLDLEQPTLLERALAEAGFTVDDVDVVISSHLHFDHAGGNTRLHADGSITPTFPAARYVIRRGEWEWAHQLNERTAASYFAHNYDPLREAGLLELVDDDRELLPGIALRRTPGHTPHHQGILITSGRERMFYLADLCPTTAHVPLPWIMGYDVEPLVTLETKRRLWEEAVDERWTVVFEHDAQTAWGTIGRDEKGGYEVRP